MGSEGPSGGPMAPRWGRGHFWRAPRAPKGSAREPFEGVRWPPRGSGGLLEGILCGSESPHGGVEGPRMSQVRENNGLPRPAEGGQGLLSGQPRGEARSLPLP